MENESESFNSIVGDAMSNLTWFMIGVPYLGCKPVVGLSQY